ncbi:hypothetical protein JD276_05505 [Leucobacter sp. CSA1]|uniref:Lipoprotein n=1 Tax=Leucobacter chromiisoli TaxID=2796471 RepID=A0A934UTK1_9MICO|nr:hypothetical protein [Leucobacter chromiisoli]MBK0418489.1 hypothetical protein [Leucobacter chromiisoli]
MEKKALVRVGGLLATVTLALGMTACSGGQSVAEACKIADDAMNDVTSEAQANANELMQSMTEEGGEVDFAAAFEPVTAGLEKAQEEVTNEEVSAALDKFATEYQGFVEIISGFEIPDMSNIDYSDPNAMAEIEAFQAEAQQLSTDMQERATSMTEAGKEMQELCNAG